MEIIPAARYVCPDAFGLGDLRSSQGVASPGILNGFVKGTTVTRAASKKLNELFHGDPGVAQDRFQCAFGKLVVQRNRGRFATGIGGRVQSHMAAFLANDLVTQLL